MFYITPYSSAKRALSLFDPFAELDRIERSFFGHQAPAFKTDILDKGESYLLEAELPGFSRDDITAEIKDGKLTLKAEKKADSENSDDGYIRRERSYGAFERSFSLKGIDEEGITAEYKDGILSVTLPKEKVVIPEGKRLEIK